MRISSEKEEMSYRSGTQKGEIWRFLIITKNTECNEYSVVYAYIWKDFCKSIDIKDILLHYNNNNMCIILCYKICSCINHSSFQEGIKAARKRKDDDEKKNTKCKEREKKHEMQFTHLILRYFPPFDEYMHA